MKVGLLILIFAVLGLAAGVSGTAIEFGLPMSGSVEHILPETGQEGPRPKVVVDPLEFDFGTMERNKTRGHSFVVRNAGNAPLKLSELATTCKCTLGKLGTGEVQPGESTQVSLQWTATTPAGPFRQTATIQTNDPLRPRFTLTVFGKVLEPVRIAPERLVLSGASVNVPKSGRVKLYATAPGLKVTSHELADATTAGFFDVSLAPIPKEELSTEDATSGWLVTLTTKPGLPLGTVRQTIRLHTNQAESSVLEVPVEVTVTGDISIAGPPTAWEPNQQIVTVGKFGSIKTSEGASTRLTIWTRGEHRDKVHFKLLNADPDILRVQVGEPVHGENRTSVQLTIEVPKGTRPMNHLGSQQGALGTIMLATGHPDSPELKLRVKFVVEE